MSNPVLYMRQQQVYPRRDLPLNNVLGRSVLPYPVSLKRVIIHSPHPSTGSFLCEIIRDL